MPFPLMKFVLLVAGVVLIVAGAGMVLQGYEQKQAAEEWDDGELRICGSAPTVEQAREIDCPDNPYRGGWNKILLGGFLVLIGGVAARVGTR